MLHDLNFEIKSGERIGIGMPVLLTTGARTNVVPIQSAEQEAARCVTVLARYH